jgi:glycine betaine catabolism B
MKYVASLSGKEYLSEDILWLQFKVWMDFKAGQFFQIIFDEQNNKFRSYSILNPPSKKGFIETVIKIIPGGYGSEILSKTNIGDAFIIRGPLGLFVLDKNSKDHIMISTGSGIVPFHSMIMENIESDNNFTLFFSTKTKENLIFYKEFQNLEKTHKNFKYIPSLTRSDNSWNGRKGRVYEHFNEIDLKDKTFYICGVKELIGDVRKILLEKGVPADNIHFERYT